jgi:hypothetical protein
MSVALVVKAGRCKNVGKCHLKGAAEVKIGRRNSGFGITSFPKRTLKKTKCWREGEIMA